jgi:hypothetical protein
LTEADATAVNVANSDLCNSRPPTASENSPAFVILADRHEMTVDPVYSHRELRPQNLLLRLPADWDNAAIQTEPAKADPRNRSRRWFQFSMRSLLIVVALPAVVCGRRRATIGVNRQED